MIADKRPTPFKHHFAINEQQSLEAKIQNLLKLLKNFIRYKHNKTLRGLLALEYKKDLSY